MKKSFAFFILVSLFCAALFSQEVTTINIENAQKTEYQKNEETGNETIFLDGNVELSVEKGGVTTKIQGDKVTYDRITKMLYAEGNVHLISTGSSAGDENITANSLIFNTSTMEGVFDGGRVIQTQSDAINLPSGSTLVVFSNMFGKSESNILAFKNASMTFCDDDDPHWKINATRMWLLSGGEFAFLNALLYVGKLPVFYLPAFYYPKDELIFNPVLGYRYREGYYIQTTTYLYGRKPLNTSDAISSSSSNEDDKEAEETLNSLYNFMKPSSLKEQKREGLVMHNLDENYTGDTTKYLKLIADWYSNLGYMIGVEGSLTPKDSFISKLVFDLDLGFTNTVFKNENFYSAYSPLGEQFFDDSNFLSLKLPFRYKANFEFSISKPFRLSLSMPIHSDPFFGGDYGTRSEDLNWINSIKELLDDKKNEKTLSEVSSFTWNLNGSWSPTLPQFMKPYLNTISLSSTSSVNISSISSDQRMLQEVNGIDWARSTPRRRFYYPSQVTPVNATASFSGTLFQYPKSSSGYSSNYGNDNKRPVFDLNKPDFLLDPEELEKRKESERLAIEARNKKLSETEGESELESEENQNISISENDSEIAQKINSEDNSETNSESEKQEKSFFEENFALPSLSFSGENSSSVQGFAYNLSYSVNSTLNTQMAYASEHLKSPDDFEWDKYRSFMYTLKVPASLSSTMSYGGSLLSMNNKISYDPVWQAHPYISTDEKIGGYTESSKLTLQKADYASEKQDILNTNTLSFKPFVYIPAFSETGVSWDTSIKLFRKEFLGDPENPEWDEMWAEWDDKSITVNNVSMVLGASEFSRTFSQKFVCTASLPPLEDKYSFSLDFSFPHFTTSFSTGIFKSKTTTGTTTEEEKELNEWKKNPFQQSATFSWDLLGSSLSLSESYNYNLEEKQHDSFKTSLSWKGLSLAYTMSMTNTYDFFEDEYNEDGSFKAWGKGWVQNSEKDFVPYSLSASYSIPTKTFYSWKNRVSFAPSLSSSLVADLVRPTNSYFSISPAITFKLNQFLSITFASTSRNSVIYRYFQSMLGNSGRIPGEDNMFIDLLNSYRFDKQSLRQSSGFKLKSLDMSIEHNLHDWKFQMKTKIEPRLIDEIIDGRRKQYYDFSPYLTIGVVWSPMEAIKTSIIDEYGEWKLD
ncbi:MAG: hypothetical protein MJ182_02195 [Treponema sp.]|nr:hypothetical protein [Treponema sp.]